MYYTNKQQLAIEKCYREEIIALLDYIQTRYNSIHEKHRKQAMERLIDTLISVLEVDK